LIVSVPEFKNFTTCGFSDDKCLAHKLVLRSPAAARLGGDKLFNNTSGQVKLDEAPSGTSGKITELASEHLPFQVRLTVTVGFIEGKPLFSAGRKVRKVPAHQGEQRGEE